MPGLVLPRIHHQRREHFTGSHRHCALQHPSSHRSWPAVGNAARRPLGIRSPRLPPPKRPFKSGRGRARIWQRAPERRQSKKVSAPPACPCRLRQAATGCSNAARHLSPAQSTTTTATALAQRRLSGQQKLLPTAHAGRRFDARLLCSTPSAPARPKESSALHATLILLFFPSPALTGSIECCASHAALYWLRRLLSLIRANRRVLCCVLECDRNCARCTFTI